MGATAREKQRTLSAESARIAVLILVGLCARSLFASGIEPPPDRAAEVVVGHQHAVVLLPEGVPVSDYENEGYRLRRVGERPDGSVEVAIDVWVAETSKPHGQPGSPKPPASSRADASPVIAQLARAVTLRSADPEERARRLSSWVARNIRYRLDRDLPQTPDAVLRRRDAYCTGASRLLVALLRASGLEAREVPGYAVAGTPNSPVGFHRWVEYRTRGGAWRFTDPLASVGFVPATFVRLSSQNVSAAALDRNWTLLNHDDALQPIGVDSSLPVGLRTVPSPRAQTRGARIRISVSADAAAPAGYRAVLKGAWIRERPLAPGHDAIFVQVPAGTYQLLVDRVPAVDGPRADPRTEAPMRPAFERSVIITREQALSGTVLEFEFLVADSDAATGPRVSRSMR